MSPSLTASVSAEQRTELDARAYEIRRLTIEMITWGRWGHIGGSLSLAEILAVLYWRAMDVDPAEPRWEGRDRLVLSKAHASPALYAALAMKGFFPVDEVYTYCELGSGLRLRRAPRPRVFCIIGDGESNEGNVWEAAMAAAHHGLDNLVAILDYNKVMAKGAVHDQMSIEPLADKWRAFGWDVLEVDGHDVGELAAAFHRARWVLPRGRPIVVIANTVKGRGVAMAEFNPRWHTQAPDPATADRMLRELARTYGQPAGGYSRLDVVAAKEAFYRGE